MKMVVFSQIDNKKIHLEFFKHTWSAVLAVVYKKLSPQHHLDWCYSIL